MIPFGKESDVLQHSRQGSSGVRASTKPKDPNLVSVSEVNEAIDLSAVFSTRRSGDEDTH
jgi:hypothetical protein